MPLDIKIAGLDPEQKTALMEKLLAYYGPKPDKSPLSDEDWVISCLWEEIKAKVRSVVRREKEAEIRAAEEEVERRLGIDGV